MRKYEETKVAIVGLGTVGQGVAKLLLEHGDRFALHAGRRLVLTDVVVREPGKKRSVPLPEKMVTTDLSRVLKNKEIEVVATLIGGIEPERSIILKCLEAGKDIVTANKALLAEHGAELFDRARELGRSIAFEAAVCGGIPIITNISQCLSANQITSLRGILNGTSNYIISQMEVHGTSYAEALKEAQRLGYAEADPSLDVNGSDAAQKLAILAHLAFGARVNWRDIPRVGSDTVQDDDLRYAGELGYHIRLLGVAELNGESLELHVSPTLIRAGRPLAEVRGAFNAVSVVGDAVGPLFFHGLGAGQMPTASAVVADMIDTAVGRARITFRGLELWSSRGPDLRLSDSMEGSARYYLRFTVEDHPGVLSQITGVLGKHSISIASVIQHEPGEADGAIFVPLVIMTHSTTDTAIREALLEIGRLGCVRQGSVSLRVLH